MAAGNNDSTPPHEPDDLNRTDGNDKNSDANIPYVSSPDDNSTVLSGHTDLPEMPAPQLASRALPFANLPTSGSRNFLGPGHLLSGDDTGEYIPTPSPSPPPDLPANQIGFHPPFRIWDDRDNPTALRWEVEYGAGRTIEGVPEAGVWNGGRRGGVSDLSRNGVGGSVVVGRDGVWVASGGDGQSLQRPRAQYSVEDVEELMRDLYGRDGDGDGEEAAAAAVKRKRVADDDDGDGGDVEKAAHAIYEAAKNAGVEDGGLGEEAGEVDHGNNDGDDGEEGRKLKKRRLE